jgi:hypothetical protein
MQAGGELYEYGRPLLGMTKDADGNDIPSAARLVKKAAADVDAMPGKLGVGR